VAVAAVVAAVAVVTVIAVVSLALAVRVVGNGDLRGVRDPIQGNAIVGLRSLLVRAVLSGLAGIEIPLLVVVRVLVRERDQRHTVVEPVVLVRRGIELGVVEQSDLDVRVGAGIEVPGVADDASGADGDGIVGGDEPLVVNRDEAALGHRDRVDDDARAVGRLIVELHRRETTLVLVFVVLVLAFPVVPIVMSMVVVAVISSFVAPVCGHPTDARENRSARERPAEHGSPRRYLRSEPRVVRLSCLSCFPYHVVVHARPAPVEVI
jgi:hypothetical protein